MHAKYLKAQNKRTSIFSLNKSVKYINEKITISSDIAKNFNNLELQEILLHTKSNLIFNLEYEKPLDADEKGYYQIVIWKCQLNEIEEEGTKKFVQEFEVEVANTYPFW